VNYTARLEKYKNRGFALCIPGYSPSNVRADLFYERYAYFTHPGVLLRLGRIIWDRITTQHVPNLPENAIMPDTLRLGTEIKNLAALIVLDSANVIHHDINAVQANQKAWIPYRTQRSTSCGEYVIVEGRVQKDGINIGSPDSDLYVSIVGQLVENIIKKMGKNEDAAHGSIRTKTGILCVYDLVDCYTPFKDLRFVLDARCDAVQTISEETFERRHRFHALMNFTRIMQPFRIHDFTANVYK
jgi:hypothetical protein